MSDTYSKIHSNNDNFPDDSLEFVTGPGGPRFYINYVEENQHKLIKFWFSKESWEKLKEDVDIYI